MYERVQEGAFFGYEGASGCIVSIIQSNAKERLKIDTILGLFSFRSRGKVSTHATKKEPIIDTIVSVIGSFSMPGYWLYQYVFEMAEGASFFGG